MFSKKLNCWPFKKTRKFLKTEDFVFYKIVDYFDSGSIYRLQCINTKAVIKSSVLEIVADKDFLYGLHPSQSCFIGLKYAEYIKLISHSGEAVVGSSLYQYEKSRYGKYIIESQSRDKNINFFDRYTKKRYSMEPRDIALCEKLIMNFDAIQSFHIGLVAGLKVVNCVKNKGKPVLKLVK